MSLTSKTKMEHLSEYEHFCDYRVQARRALASYSMVSFAVGMAFAVAVCLFWYKSMVETGNLNRVESLPCQNTSLV